MNIKIDIHQNNLIDRKIKFIPKWKVPKTTKDEINLFIDKARLGQVNEGKKLSDRTISKYLTLLKKSLEIINKQTSKISKEDIEKLDKELTKLNLKSSSDYKIVLQIFLRWKIGSDKTNKIAGWLDTKTKKKTPDYLTEQEINKLFKSCKNNYERYLIAVLFDTGARIEEFLNIRFEDIQLPEGNDTFVKIALKEEYSKTKGRTISLYWKHSLNAIRDLVEDRIEEEIKSNEPIFNKKYDAIRMFLFRISKKILNKKAHPHLFRHSSATYYANKLNRQELCYRYGWAFSSEMPDVYISRAGMESKQLDEKFKSTELEELKNQFDKERFEQNKKFEEIMKYIAPFIENRKSMIKEIEKWKDKEFVKLTKEELEKIETNLK